MSGLSPTMRSISVIAAFALIMVTMVVCAEATPSITGVPEAFSLQTRGLRGEVHTNRFHHRRPVSGLNLAVNDGNSGAPTGGVDQAPPSRSRKNAESAEEAARTKNGHGTISTRDQARTGARTKLRSHYNPKNLLANIPASSTNMGASGMASKQSATRNQQNMGRSSTFQRQNGQIDGNHHHNRGRYPASVRNQQNMGRSSTFQRQNGQIDGNHHYIPGRYPANVRNQENMGRLSTFQRQNGQMDVNHQHNSGRYPVNVPVAFVEIRNPRNQQSMGTSSSFRRDMSPLDLNHHYNPKHFPAKASFGIIGTSGMTLKQSTIRKQQSMGSLSTFQSQNSQIDVNHNYNSARKFANSFFDLRTSRMALKKSSSGFR